MKTSKYIIMILLVLFSGSVLSKIFIFNYTPATILPETGFRLKIEMEVDGHGSEINTKVLLPLNNERQTIFNEHNQSGGFNFSINRKGINRYAEWQNNSVKGHKEFSYSCDIKSKAVKFELPETIKNNYQSNDQLKPYLTGTKLIQVDDTTIINALAELKIDKNTNVIEVLKKVYTYTTYDITNTDFSGKTDAVTTLKLGQASCNGKTRLFVAMLRTLGIPTRLSGGLILKPGKKRVSHQWVEVLLGRNWVPFDPTNKHFAELPQNYLTFYYGDQAFFQRTPNVNFKYVFEIDRESFPRESDYSDIASHPLNIMNAWSSFQKAGLSIELLRVILMIPIGAIITIIFRNVIGLRTFGTFLPALIASSFRGSGLMWGMVTFISIILIGALIRSLLERLKLTHTPKLTALLVFVVFALLFIAGFGVSINNLSLAHATLFPLALMAITIERFSLIVQEGELKDAIIIFINTMVTVFFVYIVMDSLFLQTFVMAFPETMLLVIAAGIYFGNWEGLRVTEMVRFRSLVFKHEA
ncbi:hypothetical protein MNBD_IGNAVI01-1526 [hydrothermal vent metagenome]|uniref:Transglutaminase-like domain-containing protein n=1 Tax=hydrothermal vent metagenome TaxID=652676 RepID=A0A3B1BAR8_9ZZZZ